MIYTVTLNPAVDYYSYLNKLEEGILNQSNYCEILVGGKGINVSKILKTLGKESVATGYVGGFLGEFIIDTLCKENIKTDFIKLETNTRLNIKINTYQNKETEISGVCQIINDRDIELLLSKLKIINDKDILVLSGSIPNTLRRDIYSEIVNNIEKDVQIVLDTRGDFLEENILKEKGKNYLLIKPNILELENMFKEELKTDNDIIKKCTFFLNRKVKNIVVSKGKEGALLINQGGVYLGKVPKGQFVSSVGAGDSMVGGFIGGFLDKKPIEDIFRLSIACGTATAYSSGLAEYKSIEKLINDIKIKKII